MCQQTRLRMNKRKGISDAFLRNKIKVHSERVEQVVTKTKAQHVRKTIIKKSHKPNQLSDEIRLHPISLRHRGLSSFAVPGEAIKFTRAMIKSSLGENKKITLLSRFALLHKSDN